MVKMKDGTLRNLSAHLDFVLSASDGPTQSEIAGKARVDQSFVSRALSGKLVRLTKKARRLAQVVSNIYANMQNRKTATPTTIGDAVRSYLASGGDPDLLIEQMDVLRRAVRPLRRSEMPSLDEIRAVEKS